MKQISKHIGTDEELAFKQLFADNYKGLVQFAYSYLYSRSASEDLVQNVFAYFWEKRDNIEFGDKIRSYLFMTVKSRCLNELEKLKVRGKMETDWLETVLLADADKGLTEEMESILMKNIDELPLQVKRIIALKYFDGKKISEICEELKVSKNTVKTQIKRGRSMLKNSMQPWYKPDLHVFWLTVLSIMDKGF